MTRAAKILRKDAIDAAEQTKLLEEVRILTSLVPIIQNLTHNLLGSSSYYENL